MRNARPYRPQGPCVPSNMHSHNKNNFFVIVLYTKMAAVTSRENREYQMNPRIVRTHFAIQTISNYRKVIAETRSYIPPATFSLTSKPCLLKLSINPIQQDFSSVNGRESMFWRKPYIYERRSMQPFRNDSN